MKSNKRLVSYLLFCTGAAVALGTGVVERASAEWNGYAATLCSVQNGVLPNAAGGIGNWTSNTKKAFCGLTLNSDELFSVNFEHGSVAVTPGVTCKLKGIAPTATTGVTYNSNTIEHYPGYDLVAFSTDRTLYYGFGYGFECSMPSGGAIAEYETQMSDR